MKRIWVFGAAGPVGAACVERLAACGHDVTAFTRDTVNLADQHATGAAIRLELANGVPDAVVFCQRYRAVHNVDLSCLSGGIDVELYPALMLVEQARGHPMSLVFLTSIAAEKVVPEQPLWYHLLKGATVNTMRYLAAREPGITANAVMFGALIKGPLADYPVAERLRFGQLAQRAPSGKVPTAQDIAAVVDMILADETRAINGQVIMADAGMSLLAHAV